MAASSPRGGSSGPSTTSGVDTEGAAQGLFKLADVVLLQGATGESRVLCERGIAAIAEQAATSAASLTVALGQVCLASVDEAEGALAAALPRLAEYMRVVEDSNVWWRTLSRWHLAEVHAALGDAGEARRLCEEALALLERSYGRDGWATVDGLECLASVVIADSEALGLWERLLEATRRAVGEDAPNTARIGERVARVLEAMGRRDEARAVYGRALATFARLHGPDHLHSAPSLVGLARLDLAEGEPRAALALLERAVRIYERHDGAQDQEWSARFHLARALVETRGDRRRAVREATLARDGVRREGRAGEAGRLAEIEAWLAAHGR